MSEIVVKRMKVCFLSPHTKEFKNRRKPFDNELCGRWDEQLVHGFLHRGHEVTSTSAHRLPDDDFDVTVTTIPRTQRCTTGYEDSDALHFWISSDPNFGDNLELDVALMGRRADVSLVTRPGFVQPFENSYLFPFFVNERALPKKSEGSFDFYFSGRTDDKYKERRDILERLDDEFNCNFRTRRVGQMEDREQEETREQYLRGFNTSKLSIHVPQDNYSACSRVFEALAMRSCLLVQENEDLETFFISDKHLVTFKSYSELRKKAKGLLEKSGERTRIAKNGEELVLSKHTVDERVKQIEQIWREKVS